MATLRVMYSLPLITLFVLASLSSYAASQNPMGKSMERYEDNVDVMAEPRKRPFCNAFTGCGRKRSSPSRQIIQDIPVYRKPIPEESIESLMGISSEPALEELSQQILSEAKLWEAIQEASAELAKNRKPQQY